jgi:hypothetical protein
LKLQSIMYAWCLLKTDAWPQSHHIQLQACYVLFQDHGVKKPIDDYTT